MEEIEGDIRMSLHDCGILASLWSQLRFTNRLPRHWKLETGNWGVVL